MPQFQFVLFHNTDTHIYILSLPFALSIHNKQQHPVYTSDLSINNKPCINPFVSVFRLSLYRHPSPYTLFSFHFTSYNKLSFHGGKKVTKVQKPKSQTLFPNFDREKIQMCKQCQRTAWGTGLYPKWTLRAHGMCSKQLYPKQRPQKRKILIIPLLLKGSCQVTVHCMPIIDLIIFLLSLKLRATTTEVRTEGVCCRLLHMLFSFI